LKIIQAFPKIMQTQYPTVKAGYPLLTILYLLRMTDVDAVPILPLAEKGSRAVFGFSSLQLFMKLSPRHFGEVLRGPCEAASDELPVVSAGAELESLFEAFRSRQLGFAIVHDGTRTSRPGLIGLWDVLRLYGTGALRTELRTEDLGTKILITSGAITIRDALRTMFRSRHRRIFLPGGRSYVSDRSVMNYLFSPTVLEEIGRDGGRDALATPITQLHASAPIAVSQRMPARSAALNLRKDRGGCLVAGRKVVTAWDVVMKPWLTGKLTIA
jgi:CBS domain-containing protein